MDEVSGPSELAISRGVIVSASPAAEMLLGYARRELDGQLLGRIIPESHRQSHGAMCERYLKSPTARPMREGMMVPALRKDGTTVLMVVKFRLGAEASEGTVVAVLHDAKAVWREGAELAHANRMFRVLSSVNDIVIRSRAEPALLRDVCRAIVHEPEYPLTWVGYAEHDSAKNVRPVAQAGATAEALEQVRVTWDDSERGGGPGGRAIRTGVAQVSHDLRTDPRTAPWRDAAEAAGCRSAAAIPLRVEQQVIGVLIVYASHPRAFDDEELALLTRLGDNVSYGIEALRTNERTAAAETALRATEEKYRRFFEDNVAGAYVSGPDGRLLACNSAFATMIGCDSIDEAMQVNTTDLYPTPEARRAFVDDLKTQGSIQARYDLLRRRDGGDLHILETALGVFDSAGTLVELHGYMINETALRTAEQQLRQAQNLEVVGQLAAGIAHDFNNLLTTILGFTELLDLDLAPDTSCRADVRYIRDAALSGAELTRKMLALGRRQQLSFQPVEIGAFVQKFSRMLRRLIPEDIAIVTEVHVPPLTLQVDPGALEQILMNLATNARDAMPQGGTLSLEVAWWTVEPGEEATTAVPCGDYVVVALRDTGMGMDPKTRLRVFEPFFTTKPLGEGSGLGLAMVYGLVKQHNGHIRVESTPGEGTTFRIYLPVGTGPTAPVRRPAEVSAAGGTETILIVEDDGRVARAAAALLGRAGYTVAIAASPKAVMEMITAKPPDLIISDIVMPEMSGPELVEAIRAAGLSLRVIFVSGYAPEEARRRMLLVPDVPLLSKPWTADELLGAVREALDAPRA